jgi:hypothetical protein
MTRRAISAGPQYHHHRISSVASSTHSFDPQLYGVDSSCDVASTYDVSSGHLPGPSTRTTTATACVPKPPNWRPKSLRLGLSCGRGSHSPTSQLNLIRFYLFVTDRLRPCTHLRRSAYVDPKVDECKPLSWGAACRQMPRAAFTWGVPCSARTRRRWGQLLDAEPRHPPHIKCSLLY